MKKLFITIIAIISIMLMLVSCGSAPISASDTVNNRFETIEKIISCNGTAFVLHDTETGVMYLFYKWDYGGGLSPLYNADGTLMTYGG